MACSFLACVSFLLLLANRPAVGGRTSSSNRGLSLAAPAGRGVPGAAASPAFVASFPRLQRRYASSANPRRHTLSSLTSRQPLPVRTVKAFGVRRGGNDIVGGGSGFFFGPRCRGFTSTGSSGSIGGGFTTHLQVSASTADRSGTKKAGIEGTAGSKGRAGATMRAAGADLSTAPIEVVEIEILPAEHSRVRVGSNSKIAYRSPTSNVSGRMMAVLAENGDNIVVMKVFAGFCRACKAFDRKYRQLAVDYSEAGANIKFYDMDWMENRDLCKSLQVKKLPHIELYAGERGRMESFVCGPSKAGLLAEKLDALLKDPSDPSLGTAAAVPPAGPLGSNEFTDVRDIDHENRATL